MPSLRQAQLAHTIHMKEVPVAKNGAGPMSKLASAKTDVGKGKRRDWLTLLIREALSEFVPLYVRIYVAVLCY